MKNLLFSILIIFLGYLNLFSQEKRPFICNSGKYAFVAKRIPDWGFMYSVRDTQTNKTDTLLCSYIGSNLVEGFCSDSIAAFFMNENPDALVVSFTLNRGKWKFNRIIFLPETFPLIGALENGKEYIRNRYAYTSIDTIVADQTIMIAEDYKLIPQQKYKIVYKLDFERGKLILVSKEKI